jgi:Lon-like protease
VNAEKGGVREGEAAQTPGGSSSMRRDRLKRNFFPPLKILAAFLYPLLFLLIAVPTGYLVEGPGASFDLQRDVTVKGAETYPSNGELLLTSVNLEESRLFFHLLNFFGGDYELLKARDYLGADLNSKEQEVVDEASTLLSQYSASVEGLEEVGKPVAVKNLGALVLATFEDLPAYQNLQPGEVIVSANDMPVQGVEQVREAISATPPGDDLRLGVKQLNEASLQDALGDDPAKRPRTSEILNGEVKEVKVQVIWDSTVEKAVIGVALGEYFDYSSEVKVEWDMENVQGPSAGLMMTLSLINALTPGDLTGGHKIAGTGQISLDGEVGPIGGLPMKIKAAEKEGAEIFIYPQDNQEDLVGVSTVLELHAVSNLDEALQLLEGMP